MRSDFPFTLSSLMKAFGRVLTAAAMVGVWLARGEEIVTCRIKVTGKQIETLDTVAYSVRLGISIRCPTEKFRFATPSDGLDVTLVEVKDRDADGSLASNWKPVYISSMRISDSPAVPKCVPAAATWPKRSTGVFLLDRRITVPLGLNNRIRILFEAICQDSNKRVSYTQFYSQPLSVDTIKP